MMIIANRQLLLFILLAAMAFNPREALERIRQSKAAAAVPAQRPADDPFVDNSSPQLLFDEYPTQ